MLQVLELVISARFPCPKRAQHTGACTPQPQTPLSLGVDTRENRPLCRVRCVLVFYPLSLFRRDARISDLFPGQLSIPSLTHARSFIEPTLSISNLYPPPDSTAHASSVHRGCVLKVDILWPRWVTLSKLTNGNASSQTLSESVSRDQSPPTRKSRTQRKITAADARVQR